MVELSSRMKKRRNPEMPQNADSTNTKGNVLEHLTLPITFEEGDYRASPESKRRRLSRDENYEQ
jgi:hypothetical protein